MLGRIFRLEPYGKYLFLFLGFLWLAMVILGSSYLLLWPSLTSILSAFLLFKRRESRLTSSIARASALYGFLIAAYQLYISILLLFTPLAAIASYYSAAFFAVAIFYLLLIFIPLGPKMEAQ